MKNKGKMADRKNAEAKKHIAEQAKMPWAPKEGPGRRVTGNEQFRVWMARANWFKIAQKAAAEGLMPGQLLDKWADAGCPLK